ncbi:hypothetical protein [Nannocystis pusilla]|uniref:hypothetical protein n=1 Tax=Nannocystis pusilla TaxID=889268 RepID=UPI003DA4BBEF
MTDLPRVAQFLDVLVASPGQIFLSVSGALWRWTGRDNEPPTSFAVEPGEFTAWVHGAPGRVYAAFTSHEVPDHRRSRVVAIDSATGRVVARSAWLTVGPDGGLVLTYEPSSRALFAIAPEGRAWQLATPTLRAQVLVLDLRSVQERRRLAPTSDGYLAGGYDTTRHRFAPYSIQQAAPDGTLLLVSDTSPSTVMRWQPRSALPGRSDAAVQLADDSITVLAISSRAPTGAALVYHAAQGVVAVHALP